MASAWVTKRTVSDGVRYRVLYRIDSDVSPKYGGSFRRKTDAIERRNWILGELANMRIPNLKLRDDASKAQVLRSVGEAWRASRVDVADGTATTYIVNLGRIYDVLGDLHVSVVSPADVSTLVSELHGRGLARETIRKTKATLAMVLDFAGVQPNPARDKSVKLPREETEELNPPTAAHLLAVFGVLPSKYRCH